MWKNDQLNGTKAEKEQSAAKGHSELELGIIAAMLQAPKLPSGTAGQEREVTDQCAKLIAIKLDKLVRQSEVEASDINIDWGWPTHAGCLEVLS